MLELNRAAAARLASPHDVAVVPGATHLFPEEGALEQVVVASVAWLARRRPSDDGRGQPGMSR